MKHLLRKQLLDRTLSAADLDDLAAFWLRLYEVGGRQHGVTAKPDHVTEVRLRGFPRAEGPLLRDELLRRAREAGFRGPDARLTDPDTLTLDSDVMPGVKPPPAGLGLPVLFGPGFDGLVVEFRLKATAAQGQVLKTAVAFTLVLVGQVVGGVFVLKAAWRTGPSGWEDRFAWHGGWPSEKEFLAAFDHHRDTGEVPDKLAKKLFVTPGGDRLGRWMVNLMHAPLDRPRFVGLLLRLAFFAGSIALLGFAAYQLWEEGHPFVIVPLVVLAFGPLWMLSVFLRHEAKLWFHGYAQFHAMYRKLYEVAPRLTAMPADRTAALDENPYVRKLTADLRAAGFGVLGDVRIDPPVGGDGAFRVFLAPDGVTYLSVLFHLGSAPDSERRQSSWPATVSFIGHTFFADGGRAASVSGRANGYRKKRTGSEVLVRVFREADEPVEFVRLHAEEAAKFAAETGRRALRHERFEEYLRRQQALSDEERHAHADHPYTWGDHLHWYLQWPRSVYRG